MKPTLRNNFSQQKIYSSKTTTARKRNIAGRSHNHWCRGRAPLHTYSWSRVLLEKLPGSQLVKKFPAFYGTQMFNTAFTTARHLSLSLHTWIQPMFPPPPPSKILKIHLNILLPCTSGSSKWFLSVRFPHQNPVRPSLQYVLHDPPFLFFLIWSPE